MAKTVPTLYTCRWIKTEKGYHTAHPFARMGGVVYYGMLELKALHNITFPQELEYTPSSRESSCGISH